MAYKDKQKQKDYQRIWSRNKRLKAKLQACALLGNRCAKCGYDEDYRALQIDHVKPVLRKDNDMYIPIKTYRDIITGKQDICLFQLLCANCHAIKTYNDRTSFSNYIA